MSRPHPAPGGPSSAAVPSEAVWRAWTAGQDWPVLELDPAWRSVLVCAAHPDDDVLAVGATMAALGAAGAQLHLLAATDGEASHPGSSRVTPAGLARLRIAETAAALAVLGIEPASVTRLGLPDAGLAAVEAELTAAVTDRARGVDLVLAPWAHDAHPDHDALGRAARAAATAHDVPLLAFPVWMWQWAVPGDPRVPWSRVVRAPLDEERRAAKRDAVACFTSQVRPLGPAPEDAAVLSPSVLASFDRDTEVLLR